MRRLTDAELNQLEFNVRMLRTPGVQMPEAAVHAYLGAILDLIEQLRLVRAAGER